MEDNEKVVDFEAKKEEKEATVTLAPKKPSVVMQVVTAPIRLVKWCGRKMSESPVGTGIGMILGGLLTLGGKEAIGYFVGKRSSGINPAESPKVNVDPIPTTFDTND